LFLHISIQAEKVKFYFTVFYRYQEWGTRGRKGGDGSDEEDLNVVPVEFSGVPMRAG